MHMSMPFNIVSYQGAGGIRFGLSPTEVRDHLQSPFSSFKRTSASAYPCDHFESLRLFVYYGERGVEAIEFATPAKAFFQDVDLLQLNLSDLTALLRKEDPALVVEDDGCTSVKLGIGAYAPQAGKSPAAQPESIIVFAKGYYD
jgi:hypothetical protein